MTGVEVDFVVRDSLKALEVYESIFENERVEVSRFGPGTSEAEFTLYGVRIHLLDENPDYQLHAPQEGAPQPMWLNILVEDIEATWQRAMAAGCTEIQPVTHMEAMGASNAMFRDPFGYAWLLHQLHRVVTHEERMRVLQEEFGAPEEQEGGTHAGI